MSSIKSLALVGSVIVTMGACSGNEPPETAPAAEATAAATVANRVRGTVQAMTGDTLTVQTYDGKTATVQMAADTRYAWVVASSLETLKDGDFVGTATTGPKTALRAVELVIFPESMRGTGEGHYEWDAPGVVAANGGSAAVSSAMTNGTVESQSAMTNGTVETQSAMTNGTVTSGASSPGQKMLTISYEGGTADVTIPEGTPIVRFEPTERSSLATGQKIYTVTPPGASTAGFVAMGKDGLTPPM